MHLRLLYMLLLLSQLIVAAASDDDAVNERPPVTGPGLELHWGVNCRAGWSALEDRHCDIGSTERETLRLCAAIYQVPGKAPRQPCPDYARATQLLRQDDCIALREFLENSNCNIEGFPLNLE